MEPAPPVWLKEWRGDGIISRTITMALARSLQATGLPVVELLGDRRIGIARVACDDHAMGRMGVEHLLGCGFRNFGVFSYGDVWWTETHRAGFVQALAARGYSCHVYQPPRCAERAMPVWHEAQRPKVTDWVRSLPRPIGVYAVGDMHAVRLLDACQEIGFAVPEEIAILSVSNDPVICETVRPTLSSLDLDSRRIGYEAAARLERMMAGEPVGDILYTPPSHVAVRQLTDVLAIHDADVARAARFIRESACMKITIRHVAKEVGLSAQRLGTAVPALPWPHAEGGNHARADRPCENAPRANRHADRGNREEIRIRLAGLLLQGVPPRDGNDAAGIFEDATCRQRPWPGDPAAAVTPRRRIGQVAGWGGVSPPAARKMTKV